VCLLDTQGRVLAAVGEPPPEAERRALRDGAGGEWAARPVVSLDRPEALLAVRCPGRELSVDELAAADQAAGFVALRLVHERALRETHRRFAVELLDLVEAGDVQAAAVATRLRAFGIAPESPLVVATCELSAPDEHVEAVERTLADAGLARLVAARSGHLFAVVQWEGDGRRLPELAQRVGQAVGGRVPVGVGGVAQTSAGLRRSLTEALQACAIARRRGPLGYVTHDEMGSHHLLLALQDPQVLASLSSALLDPLLGYDERRSTELLPTLSAFLESNGQWQATAAALHIHVNTLRHRIARVEELTGRSLDTIDGRVDLFLALRARSLAPES
jgi:sugar diacid utilization regulator